MLKVLVCLQQTVTTKNYSAQMPIICSHWKHQLSSSITQLLQGTSISMLPSWLTSDGSKVAVNLVGATAVSRGVTKTTFSLSLFWENGNFPQKLPAHISLFGLLAHS